MHFQRFLRSGLALALCCAAACSHRVAVISDDGIDISTRAPQRTAPTNDNIVTVAQHTPAADKTEPPSAAPTIEKAAFPHQTRAKTPGPLTEPPGPTPMSAQPEVPPLPVVEPSLKSQPEDPPLVAAFRCFMNRQPAEAVALLERHNIPNQELLLMLLPMTMRLSEVSMTKMSPAEASTIAG
jgi:hypothetical protein